MTTEKAVERVWLRLKSKINSSIIYKLYLSFGIQSMSYEDVTSEMMNVFFNNFYDKYEEDEQYLRYIFIVFKNKMIDAYKKEKRYYKTHKSVSKPIECVDHTICDIDVEVNKKTRNTDGIPEKLAHQEIISLIRSKLKNNEVQVFDLMVIGFKEIEIAQKLKLSPSTVGAIKRGRIWPNTRLVMGIPMDKYEELTCSGRIFCK